MLDGIDSGDDGVFDTGGAMRVGGDFAAEAVGGIDDGFHFFGAVLGEGGVVAFGKNSAGGHEFDYVGTVFDIFADFLGNSIDAVGNSISGQLIAGRGNFHRRGRR